jgi:hypothetical protein
VIDLGIQIYYFDLKKVGIFLIEFIDIQERKVSTIQEPWSRFPLQVCLRFAASKLSAAIGARKEWKCYLLSVVSRGDAPGY